MGFRHEGGFVTAEWMAGIAMLVLPVLLIVMTVPAWAARHEAAAAAAREGARVAATAGTWVEASSLARQAVSDTLRRRGLPMDGVALDVLAAGGGIDALPRTGAVTVTVTLPAVSIILPAVGALEGPTASGSHTRALDPFRTR